MAAPSAAYNNTAFNQEFHNYLFSLSAFSQMCLGLYITLIFIVGGLGNLFTLVALPYVRHKHGKDFPILKTNTALLLLHLSFCDIIYCFFILFPLILQVPVFTSKEMHIFSNVITFADFSTIAAISVCASLKRRCEKCENTGHHMRHHEHDKVFNKKNILVMCILFWTIPTTAMSLFNNWETSADLWATMVLFSSVSILYMVIILVSYASLAYKIKMDEKDTASIVTDLPGDTVEDLERLHNKFIFSMFIVSMAYILFMASMIIEFYLFVMYGLEEMGAIVVFICLQWLLYGINLIIYVGTNRGLRAVYTRFLADLNLYGQNLPDDVSYIWWAVMRKVDTAAEKDDKREERSKTIGEYEKEHYLLTFFSNHFVEVVLSFLYFVLFILIIMFVYVGLTSTNSTLSTATEIIDSNTQLDVVMK